MVAEIVSIGTELLLGQIVNSDAAALGRRLAGIGVDLYRETTVGDNQRRAEAAIREAAERADLVFTIGGLGPTEDDLTREAVAAVFTEELVEDAESLRRIEAFFARRGLPMTENNRKQALVFRSGRAIPNDYGTAPGLLLEKGGKIVISLPGPPREFLPLLDGFVAPFLEERLGPGYPRLTSRILRFVGIGESALAAQVGDLLAGANPTVAPLAHTGEVHLRVTARAPSPEAAEALIAPVEAELRARAGEHLYGTDETTLEEAAVRALIAAGRTVAVAESCTGGLLGARLTEVPGSSETFLGGVICYSNDLKLRLCEVPPELLEKHGAVSGECARALAEGVRRVTGADYGVGITGIAGPGGGTEAKPVGLVYLGLAGPAETRVERQLYTRTRADIRFRAAHRALELLWREVGS